MSASASNCSAYLVPTLLTTLSDSMLAEMISVVSLAVVPTHVMMLPMASNRPMRLRGAGTTGTGVELLIVISLQGMSGWRLVSICIAVRPRVESKNVG